MVLDRLEKNNNNESFPHLSWKGFCLEKKKENRYEVSRGFESKTKGSSTADTMRY